MGTLKTFLESKSITPKAVATASKRIEAHDATAHTLLVKRAAKRRDKAAEGKKYAELNLEKPKTMGRGVTERQVEAAVAEKLVARKVRSKILRAVNAILATKKQGAADMKALFEGTKARVGAKPVAAAKAS